MLILINFLLFNWNLIFCLIQSNNYIFRIRNQVNYRKDKNSLIDMDKEEKKFEIFLSMNKSCLQICDLKVFLPFTINLDPFIRKVRLHKCYSIHGIYVTFVSLYFS